MLRQVGLRNFCILNLNLEGTQNKKKLMILSSPPPPFSKIVLTVVNTL